LLKTFGKAIKHASITFERGTCDFAGVLFKFYKHK